MKSKYIHTKDLHNNESPKQIVPTLTDLFQPKSVVDIGCGTGTFLKEFKNCGVPKVFGYDGDWVNRDLLKENLEQSEFLSCNLEHTISFKEKYDLVMCLEVAEHLSEEAANILVDNLITAGTVLVFSAAIPKQGGQNHLNEQWLGYWTHKFEKKGYVVDDILKPLFWNNEKIDYWYKQNMVIVRPLDFKYSEILKTNVLKDVIHKDLFLERTQRYDTLRNGEQRPKLYLKLLLKSLINSFRS
ncbi:MAG: hypothetical protein COA58_00125 [Bacteroidetes bacterium]|nr:MAG: hypothetical protein COA58_00125 [Bacteroidota bacterium]